MIKRMYDSDDDILAIRISEKLTARDYRDILPFVEGAIEKHGKINMLWKLEDFQGLTVSAAVEDFKSWIKYNRKISRIAVVGEKRWEELLIKVIDPFMSAEVNFFEPDDMERARLWLAGKTTADAGI